MIPWALALAREPAPVDLWVHVPDQATAERAEAAGLSWSEGREGDWARLHGDPEAATAAGLSWRPLQLAGDAWIPDPDTVEAWVESVAARSGTPVVDLGTSLEGRPILALRFGDGDRALRVLSGHHGDEGAAVALAMRLGDALADDASLLPEGTELWLVPALNPDGLAAGTRYSAAGVDLNRNYAHAWSATATASGPSPFSEPETRVVRALARARTWSGGLSLHSGAANVGWPWNHSTAERATDEPLLAAIAGDYAAACEVPGFYATNGADWYLTWGDENDWAYGRWGTLDFTLEVSVEKSPDEATASDIAEVHLPAVLQWIRRPVDLLATTTDAETGEAIPSALVGDALAATTTGPAGRIARWYEEEAEIRVEAPGYGAGEVGQPLVPTTRVDGVPQPRLLSRGGGPRLVQVSGVLAGRLLLTQPGEAPVAVVQVAPELWWIDPAALAPGAWTMEFDDRVLPRALFVGEADDRVRLTGARVDAGEVVLVGEGFGRGSEAWGIGGPARALHPLEARAASPTELRFAWSGDDDLLLWSNGAWLAATDLRDDPDFDRSPPEDTGAAEALASLPRSSGAGCAYAPGSGAWLLALALTAARASSSLLSGRGSTRPAAPPSRGCS